MGKAKRVATAAPAMKAMKAKRVAAPAMKAMKAKRVAAAAPAMKAMKAKKVAAAAPAKTPRGGILRSIQCLPLKPRVLQVVSRLEGPGSGLEVWALGRRSLHAEVHGQDWSLEGLELHSHHQRGLQGRSSQGVAACKGPEVEA